MTLHEKQQILIYFLRIVEKDVIEIKILKVSSEHFSEGSHVHAYKRKEGLGALSKC